MYETQELRIDTHREVILHENSAREQSSVLSLRACIDGPYIELYAHIPSWKVKQTVVSLHRRRGGGQHTAMLRVLVVHARDTRWCAQSHRFRSLQDAVKQKNHAVELMLAGRRRGGYL